MILILSGSSSCGKNTIIKELMSEDDNLAYIHTFTSREKRNGEIDGEPYFFISKEEFQQKIKNGDFFEHELIHNNFYGVEHRIEYVATINGIDFYNDSKATNVKSTQIALSAFNKPTILILGGLDRGHSFDGLTEYMKNVKLVVCYGQTKKRIKDYCDKINIKCIVKDN